jgi:hypothetical protein
LRPGTVIGTRSRLQQMRWSGGLPKGIVRWWVGQGECRELAPTGQLVPWLFPPGYGQDGDGRLPPVAFLHTPDASEEVTITANGLKYGGRLTFLYIYRFGGLRVTN